MKCPNCSGESIVKKGIRKNLSGEKQVYLCKGCQKRFVEEKGSRYPRHIIIEALNLYSLGEGSDNIVKEIRKRYKIRPSRSTVQRWIKKYEGLCPMRKNRQEMNEDMIIERTYIHRGLPYSFGYHSHKVGFLKKDFSGLKEYLEYFEDKPQFQEGNRCSESDVTIDADVKRSHSFACNMASLVEKSARNNQERHEMLENFMLVNDTATIAKEVPVYYWDKKKGTVTGHIDILQVRFGKVHILDYKPDASKVKAEGQLMLYAMGLMFRTKVPLEKMECSWFDGKDMFSFSPKKARWKWK